MSNRIELERSFILNEVEEKRIIEKINQENFKLVSEEIEEDTYFSDEDLYFVKNRICLRTRKINDNYLELTYKPKSTEETEKYGKKEVNIELNVKDHKDIKYIIKQLGYIEYVSFKKHRTTYTKTINEIERNIMLDELKDIGKFIELEVLSEKENKSKMVSELEDFIDEFECRNLERKQMPYRDIAKKYEDSKAWNGKLVSMVFNNIYVVGDKNEKQWRVLQ